MIQCPPLQPVCTIVSYVTKPQPAISVLTDGTLTEERRCAKVCCINDSSAQLADRMRCKTSEAKDLFQMKFSL